MSYVMSAEERRAAMSAAEARIARLAGSRPCVHCGQPITTSLLSHQPTHVGTGRACPDGQTWATAAPALAAQHDSLGVLS